jgi:hypothetical protein
VTLVLWNNQLTHTGMAFLGMALVSLGALFIGLIPPSPYECLIFKSFITFCVCVCACVCLHVEVR